MSSATIRMEPLSIAPLEVGWRAVVQFGGDDAPITVVPVLAWGVFAMSLVDDETGEKVEDNGNVMTGVTATSGAGTVGPFLTDLFPKAVWYYLQPGVAEPHDTAAARAERDRLQGFPWPATPAASAALSTP